MEGNKKTFGGRGEDLACRFLKKLGYEIIGRNFKYGRGELDIIAMDKDILVFVEVKTRKNLEFGPPEFAVTDKKKRQIRKIAAAYLLKKRMNDRDCRIDVVAILALKDQKPKITHYINAF